MLSVEMQEIDADCSPEGRARAEGRAVPHATRPGASRGRVLINTVSKPITMSIHVGLCTPIFSEMTATLQHLGLIEC